MSAATALFAYVDGIGLRGPGLAGWPASIDVLAGIARHEPAPTTTLAPTALPPAERRRVGKGVKVALEVGFEACLHAGRDPSSLASVFTSSSGDGDNCDAICRELADERLISPTRFHNSVHNAPSGYWGIASGALHPSTSLCAFDDSFTAGLDDALTQLACGTDAVLLVAYDAPYPEPLHAARPTPDSFAIGLVLAREPGPRTVARIDVDVLSSLREITSMPVGSMPVGSMQVASMPVASMPVASRQADSMQAASTAVPSMPVTSVPVTSLHAISRQVTSLMEPTLEALRLDVPAARALPVLAAIARLIHDPSSADARIVVVSGSNDRRLTLRIEVVTTPTTDVRTTACD